VISDRPSEGPFGAQENSSAHINTIAPRHFLQTAQLAGMGDHIVSSIFEELRCTAINSVRKTMSQLPKNSPQEVAIAIQLAINR
jgi:serine/threonine-protein kinase HipA